MKFVIAFACCLVMALAAAEEPIQVDADQDVAEWYGRGYYGHGYNPYGYSSPSNSRYYGPGYVIGSHHRGRRSVAKDAEQTVPTSYNPYGYSSPSNSRYYGPGYIAGQYNRARRSVDDVEQVVADVDDQTAEEWDNRGWGYNHGYYPGYPSYYPYYRSYGYGHHTPTSYSYSYRNY